MSETQSAHLQQLPKNGEKLPSAKSAMIGALVGTCASAPALVVSHQLTSLSFGQLAGILLIGTALGGLAGVVRAWMKNTNSALDHEIMQLKTAQFEAFSLDTAARQALLPNNELILCLSKNGDVVDHSGTSHAELSELADNLFGTGLLERVLIGDKPSFLKAISDAANGGEPMAVRLSIAVGQGPRRYCTYEFIARPTDHGCRGILRDIGREMELEEEAAAQDKNKNGGADIIRIAAHLAHELRTPLNAILGYSEMLGTSGLANIKEDQRKNYADIVHQSGSHLLNIVDNMLSVGQLKANRYEVSAQVFDLVELCKDSIDLMRQQANEANVELIFDGSVILDPIFADPRCCRQMVLNLLGNAIKFNKVGGSVTLLLGKKLGHIYIQVEDTGIGIPDEAMQRLGHAFERVDTTHVGGTGLGLVLVREMAELHGGHLRLDSILGEGTIATIELPHLRAALEPQTVSVDGCVQSEFKRRHG